VKTEGEHRRSAAIRTSLIVGYGNSLRGDDAIGEIVAQAFRGEAAIDGANVVNCLQLTPELAEYLAVVDLVVFIDAAAGIQPGRIAITPLRGAPALSMGLVHHLNPEGLLFLSSSLYGRSPDAFLVAVGAGSLELGEGLSEPVAAALPAVIAAVRQLVLRRPAPDSSVAH
jgi:hydrogenase maturation protease